VPTDSHRSEGDVVFSLLTRVRTIAEHLVLNGDHPESTVDSFSLFLQLGLHLPRFESELLASDKVIVAEGTRLLHRLATNRYPTSNLVPRATAELRLANLTFRPVPEEAARCILNEYHYLLSFRTGSMHFGLTDNANQWPWVLLSLSPFDLQNISNGDPHFERSARVLSRVYAFPGAPRNAISFAISRLRRWLVLNQPQVSTLVTYLNPNLGFTGASYEADNWRLLGYEHGTRYTYLDGNYTTTRRIAQVLGGPSNLLSAESVGQRISFSLWSLAPLRIYVRSVRHKNWGQEPPHDFHPWTPCVQD